MITDDARSSRQSQQSQDEKKQRRCLGKLAKIILILFFALYLSLGAYAFLVIESSTQQQQQNKQQHQPAMTTTSGGGVVHHQHTPPTEEIRSADLGEVETNGGDSPSGTLLLAEQDQMTRQVLDRLWDITENLNILYKENWTRLATEEVGRLHESMRQHLIQAVAIGNRRIKAAAAECNISKSMVVVQHQSSPVKWNYPTAFLYALSVITTLGSCPVIPETTEGKCLTILYAGFGIPLLLFYLTVVGSSLSSCLCCWPMRQRRDGASGNNKDKNSSSNAMMMKGSFIHQHESLAANHYQKRSRYPTGETGVVMDGGDDESIDMAEFCSRSPLRSYCPLVFCLILVLAYMACGAWTFSSLMSLSLVDALLLSFMLFTTMGVPDPQSAVWARTSTIVAVSVYILVGITLCSLCFNLIYDWLLTRWIDNRHQQQQGQQPVMLPTLLVASPPTIGGPISIEMNHCNPTTSTFRRS